MQVAAGGAAQASLRDEIDDADAIELAAAQWLVLPADRDDASLDSADKRAAAREQWRAGFAGLADSLSASEGALRALAAAGQFRPNPNAGRPGGLTERELDAQGSLLVEALSRVKFAFDLELGARQWQGRMDAWARKFRRMLIVIHFRALRDILRLSVIELLFF